VQSAGQLRRQIVDAMIPGARTAATEKGELAQLVTVDPSLLDRLTPVFQAIGSRTVNAGAVAGSSTKPSHCGGFGKIR
jgi:3-hydroxyisobutyrate dehydrogenase-like beta-hydroxyacid dehydrogenase